MPASMRFSEEGGASLSPDGKTFLAVSFSFKFHHLIHPHVGSFGLVAEGI